MEVNITKDPAYNAVDPHDFPAMLDVEALWRALHRLRQDHLRDPRPFLGSAGQEIHRLHAALRYRRRNISSIRRLNADLKTAIGDKLDEGQKIKLVNLDMSVVAVVDPAWRAGRACRCRPRSATSCAIRARRNTPPTRRAKKRVTSPASRSYIQARWGKPVAGRSGARQSAQRTRLLAARLEEARRHADAGRGPRDGRVRDASSRKRAIR